VQQQNVPYYSQPVQSMPVDYGHYAQFREVMMVDEGSRIDYMGQRFNEVEAVPAWEYQSEPPPPPPVSGSPEPEMDIQRQKSAVQRSAPPPPRSPPRSATPESEEETGFSLKAKKNKAQRSAGPRAAAPPPPPPPEVTYVDHEEPKYRTVAVERDILIPKHETVNVETIKVNERIVNVDRVKVGTNSPVFPLSSHLGAHACSHVWRRRFTKCTAQGGRGVGRRGEDCGEGGTRAIRRLR